MKKIKNSGKQECILRNYAYQSVLCMLLYIVNNMYNKNTYYYIY